MKRIQLLAVGLLLLASAIVAGCGYGHEYYPQPRSHTYFSLIISPEPGFAVTRYHDGRYYYRSPQGYMYWKGYDNRFYLDRSYLNRVHYNQREYNEWQRFNGGYHRRRHH